MGNDEPKGAKRVLYWLGLRKSGTQKQETDGQAETEAAKSAKAARRSSWVWNRNEVAASSSSAGSPSSPLASGQKKRPVSMLGGFHRRAQSMSAAAMTALRPQAPEPEPAPTAAAPAPATIVEEPPKVDATPSSPHACPLDIVIVGAGIGGLATAYLLGKAGHKVTLLEGSSQLSEVGAGFQLSPNVTRLFERWGVGGKLRELGVVPETLSLRRYEDGEMIGWRQWGAVFEKDYGAPHYGLHRADVHRILVDLSAPYATVRLSSRVVDIDPSAPSVTLASGEVVKADLIIGADGLHSRVRDTVVGHKDNPVPTGDAAYRATIPTDVILADPDLKFLVEEQATSVWMGPGRHLVGYCIRGKELYNLVMLHPAKETNENVRDASVEDMRAEFDAFEPRVKKLLQLVPSTMLWSLMDRLPLETWIHADNKVCLLGDACHPMLPYRAQGAAMALEDAAVLGNLLGRITSPSELPALLKAYETLRHPRASAVQAASRQNQHIFHLPDGPAQQARDGAMRLAMEAALKEARGETFEDCEGTPSLWADRKANMVAFGYDADAEVEKWWKENWGKELRKESEGEVTTLQKEE